MSRDPCILMAEPDSLVRQAIAEYLRNCGYRVLEAASTDEALQILNEGKVIVDIVLADANASGELNGFGLARWIRQHRPAIKVLLAGTIAAEANEAAELCEEGP